MKETAIILFKNLRDGRQEDLEVPLNITAYELFGALNQAYQLSSAAQPSGDVYLKSENPIALLKGNKTLAEYGIHKGTERRGRGSGYQISCNYQQF